MMLRCRRVWRAGMDLVLKPASTHASPQRAAEGVAWVAGLDFPLRRYLPLPRPPFPWALPGRYIVVLLAQGGLRWGFWEFGK